MCVCHGLYCFISPVRASISPHVSPGQCGSRPSLQTRVREFFPRHALHYTRPARLLPSARITLHAPCETSSLVTPYTTRALRDFIPRHALHYRRPTRLLPSALPTLQAPYETFLRHAIHYTRPTRLLLLARHTLHSPGETSSLGTPYHYTRPTLSIKTDLLGTLFRLRRTLKYS